MIDERCWNISLEMQRPINRRDANISILVFGWGSRAVTANKKGSYIQRGPLILAPANIDDDFVNSLANISMESSGSELMWFPCDGQHAFWCCEGMEGEIYEQEDMYDVVIVGVGLKGLETRKRHLLRQEGRRTT